MNHTVVFDLVNDRYTVRFPYDAPLVELLKWRVPSYARTWFSAGKCWTVDSAYAAPLAAAFTELDAPWSALKLAPRRRVTVGRSTCSVRSARPASLPCTVHFRKCYTPTSPQAAAFCNANSMMLERNWRTSHDRHPMC